MNLPFAVFKERSMGVQTPLTFSSKVHRYVGNSDAVQSIHSANTFILEVTANFSLQLIMHLQYGNNKVKDVMYVQCT